jgi:hypothetical protein
MNIDLGDGIKVDKEESTKDVIKKVLDELSSVKDSYLASIDENKRKFEQFISPGKSINPGTNSFISILRKWNSFTPVLPPGGANPKGGGYFIFHKGVGIVIDPGFNFIENYLEQGYKLDDIDAIALTHAHNDHTVELEAILSLLHKRNKSKDTDSQHKIDIYLNLGSFKKFASYFDLSIPDYPNYIRNIILLDSYNEYVIPKDKSDSDIILLTTKTKHHEMITTSYALGFVLKLNDIVIKFTGDTGWSPKLEKMNKEFTDSKQIDKIDLLIPHIGSILESEFNFEFDKSIEDNIKSEKFYDHHLGVLGCVCMIINYKPDLVIISEFGEELKSIRKAVIKKIEKVIKTKTLPGDIGLTIDLSDKKVFCSKSGSLYPYDKIEVYQIKDDLLYVADESFTLAEQVDKVTSVSECERKSFFDICKK